MIINLAGWKTIGLRCPDTEVSFTSSSNQNTVNLVQMPNGTGKSTIIELIETTLTGKARSWSPEKVSEFNSNDDPSTHGTFELYLNIDANENERFNKIVFQLNFDFSLNDITFSTLRDQTVGLEDGWKPPKELIGFLNDRCVEVFVFKGDKVRHLIEPGRTDAEESIKAFFGIAEIEIINDLIEKDFLSRQSGVKSGKGQQQRLRVLEKWEAHLDKLKKKVEEIHDQLKPKEQRRDELRTHVEEIMSGQTENNRRKLELEEKLSAASETLSLQSFSALNSLRNPFFISNHITSNMLDLKENLDKLKLPGTSGEFFKELSEEALCVCNRPIDDKAKIAILDNASGYLSDDYINIINGIKRDISKYSEQSKQLQEDKPFSQLLSANNEYYEIEKSLQSHINKMENEATQSQQSILTEYTSIELEISQLSKQLDVLNDEDGSPQQASSGNPEQCFQIPIVKKVIAMRSTELATITNTVKELEAKDKLKRILERASAIALSKLKLEIKDKSNEKLKSILPKGTPLEIIDLDKNVQLGYEGRSQSSGSGGQNVSVAYSFATSLLERSGAVFPLIVDHPVTALQESARRGLGKRLAEICHQFIGFIIDTEKSGLVDSLEKSTNNINYITLFRKISGNNEYIKRLPENTQSISETVNAIVCTDKTFFKNFKDLNPEAEE